MSIDVGITLETIHMIRLLRSMRSKAKVVIVASGPSLGLINSPIYDEYDIFPVNWTALLLRKFTMGFFELNDAALDSQEFVDVASRTFSSNPCLYQPNFAYLSASQNSVKALMVPLTRFEPKLALLQDTSPYDFLNSFYDAFEKQTGILPIVHQGGTVSSVFTMALALGYSQIELVGFDLHGEYFGDCCGARIEDRSLVRVNKIREDVSRRGAEINRNVKMKIRQAELDGLGLHGTGDPKFTGSYGHITILEFLNSILRMQRFLDVEVTIRSNFLRLRDRKISMVSKG